MKKKLRTIFLQAVFLPTFLLLTACADQGLGFGKSPPNEFLILTYPPLTVPPNIALRAPLQAGETAPTSPTALAEQVLYGQNTSSHSKMSAGEKALAQRMNLDKALPNIRALIAEDRGVALYPRNLIKKIIPRQTPQQTPQPTPKK